MNTDPTEDQLDNYVADTDYDIHQMTVTNDAFSDPEPRVESLLDVIERKISRDSYGRYRLPHPDTGKVMSWTRATTHAKLAADTYRLSLWQQRMVAYGLSISPGLLARVAATPLVDRDALDELCEQAKQAASARDRADIGTALHAFTEQHDLGKPVTAPPPYDVDVACWADVLAEHRITIMRSMIERVCVIPEVGVAGTFDRIGTSPRWELPRIVDLKSGRDLSYGRMEIEAQLALYSRSRLVWNLDRKVYEEMPEVDQHRAVVIHLPAGEANPEVYEVDIDFGWNVVVDLGSRVRKARNEARLRMWPMAKMPTPEEESNGSTSEPGPPTYEEKVTKSRLGSAVAASVAKAADQADVAYDPGTDSYLDPETGEVLDPHRQLILDASTLDELEAAKRAIDSDADGVSPELRKLAKDRATALALLEAATPVIDEASGVAEFNRPADDPEQLIAQVVTVRDMQELGKRLVAEGKMTDELKALGKAKLDELQAARS